MFVDYKDCSSVTGFNSKQLWVYDEVNDIYIDPPKDVLDEIDSTVKSDDLSLKELLLDAVICTNPEWLQDEDYFYDAEEFDI